METKKQKKRTRFADMADQWRPKHEFSKQLRATNRRVEKRKRAQAAKEQKK